MHANSQQSNEGRWCSLPYRAGDRWHWPAAMASQPIATWKSKDKSVGDAQEHAEIRWRLWGLEVVGETTM